MSVSQCQLLTSVLPEDEACRSAHKKLQAEDEWRLSHLQAAHRAVLLPCQTLPGEQMSRPVLFEHQTKAPAAAAAAQAPAGPDVEKEDGQHAESGAASRRATRRTCCRTSITREQRYHSAQYSNFWWNPTPNTSDPNSGHASSPAAGTGPWTRSPTATAAWWDAHTKWHASSAPPSPPVPADGRWGRWGWGDNELSPTSAANASSGPATAAKWSRDQPSTAPTAPKQFASICQQTSRPLPDPSVPGQTGSWLCNTSPAAA